LLELQVKDKGEELNFKFVFIDNLFPKFSRKQDYFKFRTNENSEDISPYGPTRRN